METVIGVDYFLLFEQGLDGKNQVERLLREAAKKMAVE
jgi:hypothetical protein